MSVLGFICFIGRVLFSSIFIIKSFEHFSGSLVSYASKMGVPFPSVLVPIWGIIALIGGLGVVLGYKTKTAAWLLVIFLIPTTIYMHPYWLSGSSLEAMMQHYCFWKNISLIGASLMISYFGAGPIRVAKK